MALAVMSFSLTGKGMPEVLWSLTSAFPWLFRFWVQVYGDDHEDEMGTVGYFPRNLVEEQHVYQEATKEVPTTVSVSEVARERLSSWHNAGWCLRASCNSHYIWSKAQVPVGTSETERFGRASIPTTEVERVLNFLHWHPPFVLVESNSCHKERNQNSIIWLLLMVTYLFAQDLGWGKKYTTCIS